MTEDQVAATTFPLTPGQRSLWFMQQILPESAVYHIALAVRILQQVDDSALRSVLQTIVDRHDSLRTVFVMDTNGELTQKIYAHRPIAFEVIDSSGFSKEALDAAVVSSYRRPFDLAAGPLFRSHLFTDGAQDHVLLVTVHHLVCDVQSSVLIITELQELYRGDVSLRPVKTGYRDFVDWQTQMLAGPDGEAHLAFWRAQLEGAPPVLDLPADHPRPLHPTGRGESVVFKLDDQLVQRLKALADSRGVLLFEIFGAAWHVLLHRYSGQSDILVGFVTAGRPQLRFARTTGLFSNTIVLRGKLDDDPGFAEFLQRQHEILSLGLGHQDYPFPLVVEALRVARVPGYMPLVQVLFNYYKIPRSSKLSELFVTGQEADTVQSESLAMKSYGLKQDDIEFDLTLELAQTKSWWVRLRFSTDLFDLSTVGRLAGHYRNLLQAVAADPSQKVAAIPLLGETEREEIFFHWNRTRVEFPQESTTAQLFGAQAAATPDRIAVVCGNRQLTYSELNARAEALATDLREAGVARGDLVGVSLHRSEQMVVALLAVWKAGAAYVPVDPDFPKARLELIEKDASPRTVISESSRGADHRFLWSACSERERPDGSASDLAYVLYTSGSTGKPKGVEIPHSALTNFLLSMRKRPGLNQDDVLLAVTTFSFDIAGLELFLPLITGARVVIATSDMILDGRQLARQIESCGVTVMQATPATWRLLIDSGWTGCSRLKALCGGEAWPPDLARKLLPRVGSLWNMYGPTETTIWSAVHEVRTHDDPMPLGAPIDNTTLYILDRNLQPVPIGVAGELHIGGAGLARGYRNRPDLTASRFIENPFLPGERLYKTGDLCRYRANGSVLFMGRLDDQVKLRGHRIELGEIESVLLRHAAIHEAAVVLNEERLVAYLVAPAGVPAANAAILREFVSAHLPDYMIPSVFVYLDSLPVTPNFKVDRNALRSLAVTTAGADEREYVKPRTPTEAAIALLWAETLKTPRVGAQDRFDELGGDSLSFALMTIRAGNQLGIKIPVRMDGEMMSVAGFARAADAIAAEAASPSPAPSALRSESQRKTWYGKTLLKTCAAVVHCLARIEVEGVENMPIRGPAIVAGNHISLFDFLILGAALGSEANRLTLTPTFIVAEKWRWLAGPYASQLGHTIYIRRGQGDMEALSAALQVLANQGAVAITPEGRPTRGALTRAKPGVAYLAYETGTPVWPLAVFGHERIFSFWRRLRRVPVKVCLGKSLIPHGGDLQQQADSVMKAIAALMPGEYHGFYSD